MVLGITWKNPVLYEQNLLFPFLAQLNKEYPNLSNFPPLSDEMLRDFRLDNFLDTNISGPLLYRFYNQSRDWLIQVQYNKLYINWIRNDQMEVGAYPGFEAVFTRFKNLINNLYNDDLLDNIKYFELTYHNRFSWQQYITDLSNLTEIINYKPPQIIVSNETISLNNVFSKYTFPNPSIGGFGSLSLNTSTHLDGITQLLSMEFTLRGYNDSLSIDDWFEIAHFLQYSHFTNFFLDNLKKSWI